MSMTRFVLYPTRAWNKGRLIGQKRPLKPKEVWTRACDLVLLRIEDVCLGGRVRDRATIIQRKTGRSELDLNPWPNRWLSLPVASMKPPSLDAAIRLHRRWLGKRAGLDSAAYGTHSMRRTKAAQVYRKTAKQLGRSPGFAGAAVNV